MPISTAMQKTIGWIWLIFCSISFLAGMIVIYVRMFGDHQLYVNNEEVMLAATILQVLLMGAGMVGGLALIKYKDWGKKLVFYLSIIFIVGIVGYEALNYVNGVILNSPGWQWIWHRSLAFLMIGIIPLSLCCFALRE